MDETEPQRRQYRFDGFQLDPRTRELRAADGNLITLTAKAFDTLHYLVAHRDRVVGKDELLAAVWPGRVVEENNLTQAVSALRRTLGTGAGDHRYVITVPGRGYRFVAEVHEDDAAIATAAPAATIPIRTDARSRRILAAVALALALGLFAVAAWWPPPARSPPLRSPASQAAPAATKQVALAVLPFRALSSAERDELLEFGLAETLIARLSRSPALRVRSLASAQRVAADPARDAVEAGRLLGATYVVDGSTQRRGDRVRVNARLLTVPDGRTVWADTFDAGIAQVFTLQDTIANAVTAALALKTVTATVPSRNSCDGANAEAYRAYLTGQYLMSRPRAARLGEAMAAFRQAIDLDPSCASAYAGLARLYLAQAISGDRDPGEMLPLSRAAAMQALAIDPGLAEAHAARGLVAFWHEWDWPAAEASSQRAIALNPSSAQGHFARGHLLINLGRFDTGLDALRQARELDPLSPLINTIEAAALDAARQPGAAQQRLARVLELEPDFWVALLVRGQMALDRGDTDAALADLQRAAERSRRNSRVLPELARTYMARGERARAQAILLELEARDRAGYVPPTALAAVHNTLGNTGRALDLLERAHAERDLRMVFLGIDARWNNLRAQPRFRALARRMGLESERAYGHF